MTDGEAAGGGVPGGGVAGDQLRPDLRPELDPTPLAVARYPAGWWPPAAAGRFLAVVLEPAETTVIAAESVFTADPRTADAVLTADTGTAALPAPEALERGWQRITFAGPLPWEVVGFLADVATRLAEARIPFTSVSGFTTDHVLVRSAQAEVARAVLQGRPAPELRPNVINP
jgi:hypothetical protein